MILPLFRIKVSIPSKRGLTLQWSAPPPVGEGTLMGWGRGLPSDVNENMMDVVYIRPPAFRQGLFPLAAISVEGMTRVLV